jgi:hypothetical protein
MYAKIVGLDKGAMERDNSDQGYESMDENREEVYYCRMQMQMQYYCSCNRGNRVDSFLPSFLPSSSKSKGRRTWSIRAGRRMTTIYIYAYQPLFVLGLWVVEYVRGPGPGSNSVVV